MLMGEILRSPTPCSILINHAGFDGTSFTAPVTGRNSSEIWLTSQMTWRFSLKFAKSHLLNFGCRFEVPVVKRMWKEESHFLDFSRHSLFPITLVCPSCQVCIMFHATSAWMEQLEATSERWLQWMGWPTYRRQTYVRQVKAQVFEDVQEIYVGSPFFLKFPNSWKLWGLSQTRPWALWGSHPARFQGSEVPSKGSGRFRVFK